MRTSGTTRVAVVGAGGRMGALSVAMVEEDVGMELAAAITRGMPLTDCINADVIVDFSTADAALETATFAATHGIHAILGVSGLNESQIAELQVMFSDSPDSALMLVPNFSISALMARKFAAMAVPYFESCEIIEYAHAQKLDSPSGTAVEAARELGQVLGTLSESTVGTSHDVAGTRGGLVHGIPVHSVRLNGFMNHQSILLGGPGGIMTLKYDTLDRSAYIPGIRLAIREILNLSGLHRGLESIISF